MDEGGESLLRQPGSRVMIPNLLPLTNNDESHITRDDLLSVATSQCFTNSFAIRYHVIISKRELLNREFPSARPTGNFYQSGYFNKGTY